MKKIVLLMLVAYISLFSAAGVPIGINYAEVTDQSTELVFVDIMKMARPWASADLGGRGAWDTGLAHMIPVDEAGYPVEIPYPIDDRPQVVRTVFYTGSARFHHPIGRYTVLYEGDGRLSFGGVARVLEHTRDENGGRYVIDVRNGGSIVMAIEQSSRGNNIRNIRFIMPGYENIYDEQIFYPPFLDRYRGVGVVRFTDFGATNNNPIVQWEGRSLPTYYTQAAGRGVSPEYMVMIANRMDADPWVSIPHNADDEYVRSLARLIRDQLPPPRKAYVEYSHELWNGGLAQADFVRQAGCADPATFVPHKNGIDWGIFGCDDTRSAYRYQAKRSARTFQIFSDSFGDESGRVVNVVSAPLASTWASNEIFAAFEDPLINPSDTHAHVLAVAPSFGSTVMNEYLQVRTSPAFSDDVLFAVMEHEINGSLRSKVMAQNLVARAYGATLAAYSGGESVMVPRGHEHDDPVILKSIQLNKDPRIKQVYEKYFDMWFNISDGPLVLFNSVYAKAVPVFSGHLEYQDQPEAQAPKYQAVKERIEQYVPLPPYEEPPVPEDPQNENASFRPRFSTYVGPRSEGSGGNNPSASINSLREVKFDQNGDIIVAGTIDYPDALLPVADGTSMVRVFSGNDFPSGQFPSQFPLVTVIGPLGHGATMDAFVAKYSTDGFPLWATIIGGSQNDAAFGLALSGSGDIYITGRAESADFPVTSGAYDETYNGNGDTFVLKLAANGSGLAYSTYLGSRTTDSGRGGLAVDRAGNAYVCGVAGSEDFLENPSSLSSPHKVNQFNGGVTDAVVTKLSSDGRTVLYNTFIGAPGDPVAYGEVALGCALDTRGVLHISAIVRGPVTAITPDAYDESYNGGITDVYYGKLSPSGTILYGTYFGGSQNEFADHRIAVDAAGNAYLGGATSSIDFPVRNAHSATLLGSEDGFLVKFDQNGTPLFSTYVGGSGRYESVFGPAIDQDGNLWITARTDSTDFEVTPDALQGENAGGIDAFVRKYSPDGSLLYSSYLGAGGEDYGRFISAGPHGLIALVGETTSRVFPVQNATASYNGGDDIFITVLEPIN